MTNDITAVTDSPTYDRISNRRLPCRGCTVVCKNYNTCDGKPWRMDDVSRSEKYKSYEKNYNARP